MYFFSNQNHKIPPENNVTTTTNTTIKIVFTVERSTAEVSVVFDTPVPSGVTVVAKAVTIQQSTTVTRRSVIGSTLAPMHVAKRTIPTLFAATLVFICTFGGGMTSGGVKLQWPYPPAVVHFTIKTANLQGHVACNIAGRTY